MVFKNVLNMFYLKAADMADVLASLLSLCHTAFVTNSGIRVNFIYIFTEGTN